MENKKILFITFDMSGYYISVYEELKSKYSTVDFYNTATISFKYKNIFEKIYSFFYKIFTGKKLKNYYKYQNLINDIKNNSYDITLVVRPDLFFDSQLDILKKTTNYFVAYYHDSINNIKRKSEVIHFFDKVYSYEKTDVLNFNLHFLPNFIYFKDDYSNKQVYNSAFSVMSKDYRLDTLKKVAEFFKKNNLDYNFYVMDKQDINDGLITYFSKRMTNDVVIDNIKKSNIIVDIHKYGIQDGLTFRVFEAIGYRKKIITTNKDIKTYDFYNPNNIFIIEDIENINIPISFFETSYEEIPVEIVQKYTIRNWVSIILAQ
jgi:hypothetical protein